MSLDTVDSPSGEEKLIRDLENGSSQTDGYKPVPLRGRRRQRCFTILSGRGEIRSYLDLL